MKKNLIGFWVAVCIVMVVVLIVNLFLEKETMESPVIPKATQAQALNENAGLSVSSGILPSIDKFINPSPGTIMLYDYIQKGWDSGGSFLLVISCDDKEVKGLTTKGEKVTISSSRVKYVYDPKKAEHEYYWVAETFSSLLSVNLAKEE